MKIVVENHIPFIRGVLEKVAEVSYLPPEEITRESLADADALFTRTRTRCNASLLEGTRCRFIATATIGTDHIDLDYCRRAGIIVANAPGCNAPAVGQYVMAAILNARPADFASLTLGVVGVGNVGRIVARWGRSLGMNVLLNDPYRADAEGSEGFSTLDDIAREADVITFHTPLTRSGLYPTFHLADERFFSSLRRRPVIINAARGGVVDEEALLKAMESGAVSQAVIDCWEHEPCISQTLLDKALIATPHIAGYSREGKIRATSMAVDAFCRHFGVEVNPLPVPVPAAAPAAVTPEMIRATYDPFTDTSALRSAPAAFETLRNTYPLRTEPWRGGFQPPAEATAMKFN